MTGSESTVPADGGMEGDERRPHPLRNWRQPLLTAVSMSIAVALVAVVDPVPGPLVLAAVLAMTLSRNRLVTTWRGRLEALILLPVVGLATAGVAYLFVHLPIIGAASYVIALFLSIWLRKFGSTGFRVGSLIALPFITLLISPGAGVGTTPLGVALLSVVVLVVVVALRLIAEVTHFVARSARPNPPRPNPARPSLAQPSLAQPSLARPNSARPNPESPTGEASPASTPRPASATKPLVSTRMALQMAIALAAAFIIGWLVFPQHVSWVVLTAFIVCSGNRGRADVLYKSGLRIVGASVGTILASAGLALSSAAHVPSGLGLQGPPLVVVLLVIISIGLWLREWTYAAWAVAMTLVITLLQGVALHTVSGVGVAEGTQLWIRILAIIVGAVCGIAASWFVMPVRSEGVVRRRIADALAALNDFVAERDPATEEGLTTSLERLDEVGAPWEALERVTGWRKTSRKPGQWMDLVHECAKIVRSTSQVSSGARRALAEARRSMRNPDAIGPALLAFRDELERN